MHRGKGNKIQFIVVVEFIFAAHKVNVQTSYYAKHKRTLALTDELQPRTKWGPGFGFK